jgi:transcription antitermination factor NusG
MEMKWHAVYTKPRWEKKVDDLLTRKEIESYCPLNRVQRQWSDRKKIVYEPLFTSYVFVHVQEKQLAGLRKVDGIINLVYWLGKPAVIRDQEIEIIKRFLGEFTNVHLEKKPVNVNDMVRVTSGLLMEHEGQVVAVKNKTVKVLLPSLGYRMVAELETSKVEVIDHWSMLDNDYAFKQ